MVGSGMHINAIGGDCLGKTQLHRDVLLRSDIFVEYPARTRIEGEVQQSDPDHPVTEIWQFFIGKSVGRSTAKQITLFDSVGFAIEDFRALRYVREQAENTTFCSLLICRQIRMIHANLWYATTHAPTTADARDSQNAASHILPSFHSACGAAG